MRSRSYKDSIESFLLSEIAEIAEIWEAIECFDSKDWRMDKIESALKTFDNKYALNKSSRKSITLTDLLLEVEYKWIISLLPKLLERIKHLEETEADYELTDRLEVYLKKVCKLLPDLFYSFSTLENIPHMINSLKSK